jgi:hypothetical protein
MPVIQHQRAQPFLPPRHHPAVAARPLADVLPADPVGESLRTSASDIATPAGPSPRAVAVQIGRHDQPRARQAHRQAAIDRTLATRQHPTRGVALAPQPDPVGIGQRRHLGQRRPLVRHRPSDQRANRRASVPDALDAPVGRWRLVAPWVAPPPHPQVQIGRAPAHRVALLQKGGQGRRLRPRDRQHMRQARMQGQRRQLAAMAVMALARPARPSPQQRPRLGQRRGRRRGQERQVRRPSPKAPVPAPAPPDRRPRSRPGERRPARLLRPWSTADSTPLGHPPRPAPALLSLGPRHPFRHQPRHARAGSNRARRARPPSTTTRTSGRSARFRRSRSPAPPCAPAPGPALRAGPQSPSRRTRGRTTQSPASARTAGLDPPDFALARQEDQHPALRFPPALPHQPRHCRLQRAGGIGRAGQPARLDRKGAALGGDDRRIPHQGRHRGGVQRGRHHQKPQVGPQRPAHLQAQRQPQIGIQAALVEFVKDHQRPCRKARGRTGSSGSGCLRSPPRSASPPKPSPRPGCDSRPSGPTTSPKVSAIRSAAPRAASRRGSSITMRPGVAASRCSGTSVVFPAPGGACNIRHNATA